MRILKKLSTVVMGMMIFIPSIHVDAKDYQEDFDSLVDYYSQNSEEAYESNYDYNEDGIIDILDVASASKQMGTIDVTKIKSNYLKIISNADKRDYESLGIPILTTKSFVVTNDGLDLFGYVNAARGMRLEFIEGDRDFTVQNDTLYLTGVAPAMAKVRLVNDYALSDPFYIYGTSDRSLHSFTYDYFMNIIQNQ